VKSCLLTEREPKILRQEHKKNGAPRLALFSRNRGGSLRPIRDTISVFL